MKSKYYRVVNYYNYMLLSHTIITHIKFVPK